MRCGGSGARGEGRGVRGEGRGVRGKERGNPSQPKRMSTAPHRRCRLRRLGTVPLPSDPRCAQWRWRHGQTLAQQQDARLVRLPPCTVAETHPRRAAPPPQQGAPRRREPEPLSCARPETTQGRHAPQLRLGMWCATVRATVRGGRMQGGGSQGGPSAAPKEEAGASLPHHWPRLEALNALGAPRRVRRAAPPPREPRSQRQCRKAAPHTVQPRRGGGPGTQRARGTHTRRHPCQCSGVHPARRTPAPPRPSARACAVPEPRRRCSHGRRERLGHRRRRALPPAHSRAQVCSRRAPRED